MPGTVYSARMELLPVLKTGKLMALCAPDAARTECMDLIAELGLRGPVTVLDGGNRYRPYQVAAFLRRRTADVSAAANRMFSRRAFTCYEMKTLLESTPSRQGPCVVLDLLGTFYDDHVPTREACRLLRSCLGQLQRLALSGPVVVSLAPPQVEARAFLVEWVCQRADQVFSLQAPTPQPVQPALF